MWRFEFGRRELAISLAVALLLTVVGTVQYASAVMRASVASRDLQQLRSRQERELRKLNSQATDLDQRIDELQRENEQLRGLIAPLHQNRAPLGGRQPAGVRTTEQTVLRAAHAAAIATAYDRLMHRVDAARRDEERLRGLAFHVLNLRRLAIIARDRMIAEIPSINPVDGAEIASGFGWRTDPWPSFHKGVDLDADYGTPVHATAPGTIAEAGWDGGYGLKVVVDHHNGFQTWYAHLSRIEVNVGDAVNKGQLIAAVGETGDATGPHLHYQVMHDGEPVDPAPYLNGAPRDVLASFK